MAFHQVGQLPHGRDVLEPVPAEPPLGSKEAECATALHFLQGEELLKGLRERRKVILSQGELLNKTFEYI